MTLNEAIQDPKRPLSINPMEWMLAVEADLAEDEELTKKVTERLAAKKSKKSDDDTEPKKDLVISGIETIDMGIDQIIQGIKLVYSGLDDTDKANMTPEMRKAVENIKDLMDTAIVPYMKDIVGLSDSFDEDNGEN